MASNMLLSRETTNEEIDAFSRRRQRAHESNAISEIRDQYTRRPRHSSRASATICPCASNTTQSIHTGPVLQILNVPIRQSSDIGSGRGKEHGQLRTVLKYISRLPGWESTTYDRDFHDLSKLYIFIRWSSLVYAHSFTHTQALRAVFSYLKAVDHSQIEANIYAVATPLTSQKPTQLFVFEFEEPLPPLYEPIERETNTTTTGLRVVNSAPEEPKVPEPPVRGVDASSHITTFLRSMPTELAEGGAGVAPAVQGIHQGLLLETAQASNVVSIAPPAYPHVSGHVASAGQATGQAAEKRIVIVQYDNLEAMQTARNLEGFGTAVVGTAGGGDAGAGRSKLVSEGQCWGLKEQRSGWCVVM